MHNSTLTAKRRSMDKKKKKKFIIILTLLCILMLIGLTLYAIGQGISSFPLMLAELLIAGISLIPILIITIVAYYKYNLV